MEVGAKRPDRWAIILAGGEGIRLRPLTRRTAGDERPKQFCPLVDGETLLDRTRARVARIVRPDRTCLVLTGPHERFYAPLLAEGPVGPLVVQPCGRGTAPAIALYARLPSTNFSEDVLGTRAANLTVLPVRGVTWSDWGEPARVFGTLGRLGIRPEWANPEVTPVVAAAGSGR